MIMNPLVSISVPVYNAEKYICQCLDSLISQTLKEIEIIVVDDGSTDKSGQLCEDYAAKDNRIIVIHKENGGLASARQVALEIARGDFFCACDADDWAELTMYEHLYKKAIETGADIVMCDYYSEYGDGISKASCYGKQIPDDNNHVLDDALNGRFPQSVWSKMFKRDLFERYNLSWEPGINMGEDFLMTLKILQYPARFAYIQEPLYHYRRMPDENSYTNRVTLNSYDQMLRIQEWIEKNINRNMYEKGIKHNLINIAFAGLRVEERMTPNYYRHTSTDRLSVTCLLKEHSLKSLVILWTKMFGYRAGLFVFQLMYRTVYR